MVTLFRFAIMALLIWAATSAWTWNTYIPLEHKPKTVGITRHAADTATASPAINTRKLLATLERNDLWGLTRKPPLTASAVGNTPKTDEPATEIWSRVAIVREPKADFVLLRSPAGELKAFRAGDALPDDSKLKKISSESVEVRLANGQTRTYRFVD